MKIRRIWSQVATTIAALAVLVSGAGMAIAAPAAPSRSITGGANGLRISPVRSDMTINPGQTQTLAISVVNVTGTVANLQAVVNDFIANPNESGEPALILDPNQFAPSHSLKRYIQPIPGFTLQAGQQKTINITISVPSNAAGGGYYGAIRFAPGGSEGEASRNVTLAGSVGSLVLVKVPGNIKEQLSIASFDVRRDDNPSTFFTKSNKISAVVRFQNGGNIQESPFGKILLKNRSGKIIAEYEVNNVDPRGNVLPDSIRKFPVPIDKVGRFGQYKLEGNFGYGTSGQLLSASTTFYVIPVVLIMLFVAIVLVLAFMIFGFPRMLKAYNRRVISQANTRRK